MRKRAASISAATPGERLPVPHTRDEIERLGETLNAMLARLEAGIERERGFVADAGHELRTPLALLRTELELALLHADSADDLREAVRRSSIEVDRLVQLAEDLLLMARRTPAAWPCGSSRSTRPNCSPPRRAGSSGGRRTRAAGSPSTRAARRRCAATGSGSSRRSGT